MTSQEWEARATAFEEAAEHLGSGQHWTDDATEFKQGLILADRFRLAAIQCQKEADKFK